MAVVVMEERDDRKWGILVEEMRREGRMAAVSVRAGHLGQSFGMLVG